MRRSFLVAAIVPALAFAAVSFVNTREAAAGPKIDFDADLGMAFQGGNPSRVDFSAGGGLRLGYRFSLPGTGLYLQPEIGGHYMHLGFNNALGYDYAATVNGGLRFGLSGPVQPNVFAHLGLGILGYQVDSAGDSSGYIGPNADIGAGIDFRIAPGFTLGAQLAYNTVAVPAENSPSAAKWLTVGLTAGFHFGEPRPRPVYVRRYYY
jgi:hypothetical protein